MFWRRAPSWPDLVEILPPPCLDSAHHGSRCSLEIQTNKLGYQNNMVENGQNLLIMGPGVHPKLGIKNKRIGSKAPDICLCAHSAVKFYEFEACFLG